MHWSRSFGNIQLFGQVELQFYLFQHVLKFGVGVLGRQLQFAYQFVHFCEDQKRQNVFFQSTRQSRKCLRINSFYRIN